MGSLLCPLLFIMFINDLHISITDSKFRHIRTPPGKQLLQRDLDNLLTSSNLHFINSSKKLPIYLLIESFLLHILLVVA